MWVLAWHLARAGKEIESTQTERILDNPLYLQIALDDVVYIENLVEST